MRSAKTRSVSWCCISASALERHYNIGYQRQPKVLLVCDAGNAMARMIEAILQRKYPQVEIAATLSQREYEQLAAIPEDFVISTARISEKDKPVITIRTVPHRLSARSNRQTGAGRPPPGHLC
ncbi:Uncharacterised protein [Kluyvera cryocrescens]|uniref:PTS EIIB type-2 domain-containing protein n=1 Tax=Kluyvera cryocrescens TaxID=580 RepID=A0A485BEH2_KLUCR|nr:Uncharacterised protein [Kluyvera cryocrescens]